MLQTGKVVGLIPAEVFGLFNFPNPYYGLQVDSVSDRNVYQESSWDTGERAVMLTTNHTAICEPNL
jgi:hypothetical protein